MNNQFAMQEYGIYEPLELLWSTTLYYASKVRIKILYSSFSSKVKSSSSRGVS